VPDIVNPRVESYLRDLYRDSDAVREEMEELARQRRFPIVGPLVGRHLELLARAIGARRVFELGSGFGYSALYFARAVGPGGEVHCTDLDEDNVRQGRHFLARAGFEQCIIYHCQEATAALREVGGSFDVIYNDVEKTAYPAVIELARAHLRPGGLFLSDNVLWKGRLLEGEDDGAPATAAIREFNRRLFADPAFLTCIDPTRDGLSIALRR
jgi:predicted O-methyltransferase YrrM